MSADGVTVKLLGMRQTSDWAKMTPAHVTQSLAYAVDALLSVAEAALAEHASHFDQYKDDEEGCATCYYLNQLAQ